MEIEQDPQKICWRICKKNVEIYYAAPDDGWSVHVQEQHTIMLRSEEGIGIGCKNKFSENAILPACCCVYAWPGKKSFNSGDKQNVTIDSPLLKVLFSYLGKKHKPDHP